MDPNSLPQPQFDLPSPQQPPELGGVNPNAYSHEAPRGNELRNIEFQSAAGARQPTVARPAIPAPPVGILPSATSVPAAQPALTVAADDNTLMAEDSDLIEKEWVQKAKAIVDQTRNDPHVQSREINRVKATYIKKRYNKDIKVSNE